MAEIQNIAFPQEINFIKIHAQIAQSQNIPVAQVEKTLTLLKDGNTVPFIARYRKEVTGALNEIQLRAIQKEYESISALEDRKLSVLRLIAQQNKLTEELRDKIVAAENVQIVEDLYLPFKPKHKTLGAKAREKGLAPLADQIKEGINNGSIEEIVKPFINPEKGIADLKEALDGAVDIIAEEIGDNAECRQYTRDVIFRRAVVKTKVNQEKINEIIGNGKETSEEHIGSEELGKKKVDPYTFKDYFDFTIDGGQLQAHQILALNRAEDLDILSIDFDTPDEMIVHELKKNILSNQNEKTNLFYDYYNKAVEAGYKRYIQGSLKREYWRELREKAETHSIGVFAKNLKNLLMTPPIKGKAIIGIDPGFRTGCKVAVIDKHGKFLDHGVIYPHPPKNQKEEAKKILLQFAKKYTATAFAIGNGTASRETEMLVVDMIQHAQIEKNGYEYAMVSEAGASVYSASDIAIEEFPDLDLTVRGAISIARRLQDPLSELIKIDPKSIGVGMYQHDVNQNALKAELDTVIEDCVNGVGVDLNTASSKLLEYVSGLNKTLAKAIVNYRNEKGAFLSRNQLKEIRGLGPKTFEQSAGFLKIRGAANPLDSTFVHPESYDLVEKIIADVKLQAHDLIDPARRTIAAESLLNVRPNELSRKFSVDADKVRYLVDQLRKPDLDPRDDLPPPILRKDILSVDDLKTGMVVTGTVRNVVDFGAFVDIGVKINGLVHKSQIANTYVKNPHDFLAVGDIKDFLITGIDKEHNRIQLSLKQVPQKKG